MVVEKGGPALVVRSARAGKSFPVFTDRARGEANVELEPEFLCDSPFAPGQVVGRHAAGLIMTKALRQSKKRASLDNTNRSAAVVRLTFFSRS